MQTKEAQKEHIQAMHRKEDFQLGIAVQARTHNGVRAATADKTDAGQDGVKVCAVTAAYFQRDTQAARDVWATLNEEMQQAMRESCPSLC